MSAENTLAPTAETSGFRSPASRMPRDEKLATLSSSPGTSWLKSPAEVPLTVTGWLASSAASI